MKFRITTSIAAMLLALAGCVSPLKSSDPAVRKQAMEQITDQQELFFIAMNVGVGIKDKWPEMYKETHLRPGEYAEDVRLIAVQKINDPKYLVKCATWQDNDVYVDPASETGRFQFKGETLYLTGNFEVNMTEKVAPGDAVRSAAANALAKPEIFRMLPQAYVKNDERKNYDVVSALFPKCDEKNEVFFSNYGRSVRPNNPLNQVIAKASEKQSTEDVVMVLSNCSEWLPIIAPLAYDQCLKNKLDGIKDTEAKILYHKLFLANDRGCSAERFYSGNSSEGYEDVIARTKCWPWLIYQHIENPDLNVVRSALKNSDSMLTEKILGRVKAPEIFVEIYGSEAIVKSVPKDKTKTLSGAYGSETTDLLNDEAAKMLKRVNDQNALVALAHGAKLFSIRAAAIARVENENELAKIARGEIKDCPYDTSLAGHNLFGNGIEWISKTQDASKANLQRLAIARMNDARCLRDVRKECKSEIVKKAVTARLSEIGQSDVAEICAYDKYDSDLFSMVAGLKDKSDIQKVSQSAKLKGIRILAGSKLDTNTFAALSKKEAEGTSGKPVEGKLVVAGYYLGMNIEDAFAKLAAEHPDVKPTIYLDDGVLCIAGSNGRDIAWANVKSLNVHWLTLPPSIVKQMAGFKTGSFKDLERAVERKLGISFGYDVIRKGSVSQKIGNFENTEGETLRYFISEIGEGEDFGRSIRKAVNQHTIDTNPLNGGFGAALANAFEDAQQADENRANARRPMFQPQGSLQLLLTKNAAKGSLGSKGSIIK